MTPPEYSLICLVILVVAYVILAVIKPDFVMEKDGIKVLVDAMSMTYLEGAEIDYKKDLTSAQFVINNPNATSTCGCGSSFAA